MAAQGCYGETEELKLSKEQSGGAAYQLESRLNVEDGIGLAGERRGEGEDHRAVHTHT